jgi:hypothetical protein
MAARGRGDHFSWERRRRYLNARLVVERGPGEGGAGPRRDPFPPAEHRLPPRLGTTPTISEPAKPALERRLLRRVGGAHLAPGTQVAPRVSMCASTSSPNGAGARAARRRGTGPAGSPTILEPHRVLGRASGTSDTRRVGPAGRPDPAAHRALRHRAGSRP